jgi:Uma2 family endonuclease
MDKGSFAVSVETQLMTFAEFEKLPDPPAGHYELRHGEMVLVPPRKKIHEKQQRKLFGLLLPRLDHLGFLNEEMPFRAAPECEYWQCDIGFITQERWDADHNDYFLGAPDLVIEILSPSNTMHEMLDRQDVCLDNGCLAFWTVDLKRQTVMVTTPDRKTVTYGRGSSVPLPEPYQGAVAVSEIFNS